MIVFARAWCHVMWMMMIVMMNLVYAPFIPLVLLAQGEHFKKRMVLFLGKWIPAKTVAMMTIMQNSMAAMTVATMMNRRWQWMAATTVATMTKAGKMHQLMVTTTVAAMTKAVMMHKLMATT